jgi:phospholipase/carboxylesterase
MFSLEVKALNKNGPKNLIIFLHGLGSNGEDLLGLVPYIQDALPNSHFYSPDGIQQCDMSPFGYQWFSLKNRAPEIMLKELENSAPAILDLIESKLLELNLTFEHLVLVGFSQGTMTSLYLATAFNLPIAAVVGFSGAFIPPKTCENTNTPICLIHGTSDEVVPHTSMLAAKTKLQNLGFTNVETHSVKNLSHSIDLNSLKTATNFINKFL